MESKNINGQILEQQFSELLSMINYHRSRASQAVNEQQLLTAWNVGAYISNKLKTEQWGSKVVTQFSEYMKTHAPEQKGFSRRNVYNMVMFYDEYSAHTFLSTVYKYLPNEFVQLSTAQIQGPHESLESDEMVIATVSTEEPIDDLIKQMPVILYYTSFTNHIAILNQCVSVEERLFYILYAHRERLNVKELQRCMNNDTCSSLLGSKHNYYCPLKNIRADIKLGLIPFAGVSPFWLFWSRQTNHK